MSEPLTPEAAAYIGRVRQWLTANGPEAVVARVEALVSASDEWRERQCLNLNPAESGMSRRARGLLASAMATRLSEGLPGDKLYPPHPTSRYVDEIEALVIALAERQFDARFLDWRPVSTSMANATVFATRLKAGDVLLSQDDRGGGGNYSYNGRGAAALMGSRIVALPMRGECFEVDLEGLDRLATQLRPKMIVVGGSHVLFPYPVEALREIADRTNATLLYDAAHLGLLISSGGLQRPLQEGAHVVTISTHKIMGGPVGGMALTNDPVIAGKLLNTTFPGFLQTRDQNKYAALAISLAETARYGRDLAAGMVANAQRLGRELSARGVRVLGSERGCTRTHQLFLDLGDQAAQFEKSCVAANVLLATCVLSTDAGTARRSGIRLATHEVTLNGMGEGQMPKIAELIVRAACGQDPQALVAEVRRLIEEFPRRVFSFDGEGAEAL